MTELINLKPERTYAKQPVLICEMCAIYAVNRDTSAMEPDEEQRIVSAHSEISSRGWMIEPVDPYEIHFSYERCDTCSTSLGGNRMDAYLVSMYSADEIARLMIADIQSLRPEINISTPDESAEDDSADGEALYWLCDEYRSAGEALDLFIMESDGYWIYDLRLVSEAEAECIREIMQDI